MTDGLPIDAFVRVECVMPAESADRLAHHLDTIELSAEVRWAVDVLGRAFGWTEREVKIGSILRQVVEDLDRPQGGK